MSLFDKIRGKCCICGAVRCCAPYLDQVIANILTIGQQFEDFSVVFSYDISSDGSLQILEKWALQCSNIVIHIETEPQTKYRVYNIARARNRCLDIIREKYCNYEYFIMIDCDNVCEKMTDIAVFRKYFDSNYIEQWDSLSFITKPYYDTWALSKYPYVFSNMHFANYHQTSEFIEDVIEKTPKGDLIPCLSAFNGFAIYKTNKFINYYYDYKPRLDLIPKYLIKNQINICGPIYLQGKAKMIDCEHRSFHLMAVNDGARIRIANDVLFNL